MDRSSLEQIIDIRKDTELKIARLHQLLNEVPAELKMVEGQLYQLTLKEVHIREIYRLAEHHFPRLQKNVGLTEADVAEIEKWIHRAHSDDGYADIINALRELEKYTHADIRQNLYALVQKIIIGGAFKEKRKK